MRKKGAAVCLTGVIWFVTGLFSALAGQAEEARFDFLLGAPQTEQERQYLGLGDTSPFILAQIDAPVILIQIFSMYCPICQREASHVNTVYELIKNNEKLNRQIRMIGIGAGNSGFEVQFYQSNYKVEFPLFSDADYAIHKKVQEVGTPHFFVLKRQPEDQLKLVFSHSGDLPEPEKFLQKIINAVKMESTP